MKIGIVTHWNSQDNYGQQLQCYALQTLLRRWGHDAYLIRYAPKEMPISIWRSLLIHIAHPKLFLLHLPISTAWKRSVQEEQKLQEINLRNNPIRQFEHFRKEHLLMTERIYTSYSELQQAPPEADVYIAGSDQIWRSPLGNPSSQVWFLKFGSKMIRRISYAASMGEGIIHEDIPLLKQLLSGFDAISVREFPACQLCRELGYEAQVCIDPTMLLSMQAYHKIAKPIVEREKYAFLYMLNVKCAEDFYWSQIKNYLEEEKLQIKSVTGTGYYQGCELIEGNQNLLATIPEWLGYIEGAHCVFTTSFHGTVFAIIMHRPFLSIRLEGKYSGANSRIEQILSALGISERIYNPGEPVRKQMESSIDWQEIDYRVNKIRLLSIEYLKDNLV